MYPTLHTITRMHQWVFHEQNRQASKTSDEGDTCTPCAPWMGRPTLPYTEGASSGFVVQSGIFCVKMDVAQWVFIRAQGMPTGCVIA